MNQLPRPGRIVRCTLALLGVLFIPLGIWFLRDTHHRYWTHSAGLFLAAIACLYLALRRDSPLAALDDL
jgi:hypothetical protein